MTGGRPRRPAGDGLRPVVRLLTLAGVLRARPCALCGALVVLDGEQRHDAQHRADAQRGDDTGGAR